MRPGALRALVDFAEAHPQAGAVGARLEYEDGRFQHSAFRFPDWKQAFFGFFDGLVPLDSEINGRYPPEPARPAVRRRAPAGRLPAAAPRGARAGRARSTRASSCTSRRRTSASRLRAGRLAELLPAGRAGDARQRRQHVGAPASRCRSSSTAARRSSTAAIAARAATPLLKAIVWAGHRLPARAERARLRPGPDRRAAAARADRRLLEDSVVLTGPNGVERAASRHRPARRLGGDRQLQGARSAAGLPALAGARPRAAARRGLGRRQRLRRRLGRDGRRPSFRGSG